MDVLASLSGEAYGSAENPIAGCATQRKRKSQVNNLSVKRENEARLQREQTAAINLKLVNNLVVLLFYVTN